MILPPGPGRILTLLPSFAFPAGVLFFGLRTSRAYHPIEIPTWFAIVVSLLARPILFFVEVRMSKVFRAKAAATRGAVLAPMVQESPLAVIPKFAASQKAGYPGDVLLEWAKEYGNVYQLDLLTTTAMVTMEPDHIKAILSSQFDAFEKGPLLGSQLGSLIGEGVFNSDGELWKFHRLMSRPFFTRERITDFDIFDRICERSLSQAKKRIDEGFPFDIQDLASRFALDVSTVYLMGHNVESTSVGLPYPPSEAHRNPPAYYTHPSTTLTDALAEAQEITNSRIAFGAEWPLAEFWGDEVVPYKKVIDGVVEPFVRRALEKREQEEKENRNTGDREELTFLAHIVKHIQDPVLLRDELINMLLAGRDTTMSFLAFSAYMLTQHPDVEHRLRKEISAVVGMTARPTDEMVRDLKYMKAFLNEVLRLYPSVPLNLRMTNKDVTLPASREGERPFYVPKDTTCIYHVINMHRRTDLWGPDALSFDPDRFLDERYQKYLASNPYIFCPFNAGPRVCIGQQLAYNEATYFLVRLLQRFTGFTLDEEVNNKPPPEWAACEGLKGTDKIRFTSHLAMFVPGGLWIRMRELKASEAGDALHP